MNTDEALGIRGGSCYQIAAASLSVDAATTPIISLPTEWVSNLRIDEAVVHVMSFQQRGRYAWPGEADSPR